MVEFTEDGLEGGEVAGFGFSLDNYFEVGTVKGLLLHG